MEVTQELILEYLKNNFISLSKSSDSQDEYTYEFMINNGLMAKVGKDRTATITNDGRNFINNSYDYGTLPLTVYDWKLKIIDFLKDGERQMFVRGSLMEQAKLELMQDGIIEQGTYTTFLRLTTKGRNYLNSEQNYNDFLIGKHIAPNLHIGHNITGDINQSDFRLKFENNRSNNAPAKTQTIHPIKELGILTIKNIAKFIFYVFVGLVVWYFTILHPIIH